MDSYWEWNKENFDWHYDPSSDHKDVTYVGRFAHPNLEQVVQETVANLTDKDYYNEVSIKGEPYNEEAREIMEGYHNDLTRAGFNEHNTGGRQTRQDLPTLFQVMAQISGLWNPQIMFLEQPPGKFVPWHRDAYNNYRRNFAKVDDSTEVIRYLVQLNDWQWGHYVSVGNEVIHQYKMGDIHCWPEGIYHATGNAGLWPRYALTITGCVGPDSLHLKKPQQYDL
jgi:hypothetical protein|tara:strand:- start:129 stop:800 length:672 start_codon:yes stop_codon:yes gene_type:complete